MKPALILFTTLILLLCCVLLARGFLHSRSRMLLWSALCFAGLTAANGLIFVDLYLIDSIDFHIARLGLTVGALAVLVFGFIWDSDRT